ncbi:MAG: hypothetical protein J5I98_10195 [Phaeodactylibacter sp.]|nr:hypothetical protein [Phaeodactylibacter sp.]
MIGQLILEGFAPANLLLATNISIFFNENYISNQSNLAPNKSSFKTYPNPAPGYFKVVFEEALRRPGRAVLYNGLGQVALEAQLEAGSREFRIELSGVAPGLCFYSVFRDGAAVKGGKLVVAGGR